MITINNPVLEKKIISIANDKWETAENYIMNMIYFFEKNNLLKDIYETKKYWKTFNNVDDLMKDLLD